MRLLDEGDGVSPGDVGDGRCEVGVVLALREVLEAAEPGESGAGPPCSFRALFRALCNPL